MQGIQFKEFQPTYISCTSASCFGTHLHLNSFFNNEDNQIGLIIFFAIDPCYVLYWDLAAALSTSYFMGGVDQEVQHAIH